MQQDGLDFSSILFFLLFLIPSFCLVFSDFDEIPTSQFPTSSREDDESNGRYGKDGQHARHGKRGRYGEFLLASFFFI